MIAGLGLTILLGLTFLLIQAREYTRLGFALKDNAFATTFFGLTGLHGLHVFVGLNLLAYRVRPRQARPLLGRSTITASRCPGSTGTSST